MQTSVSIYRNTVEVLVRKLNNLEVKLNSLTNKVSTLEGKTPEDTSAGEQQMNGYVKYSDIQYLPGLETLNNFIDTTNYKHINDKYYIIIGEDKNK